MNTNAWLLFGVIVGVLLCGWLWLARLTRHRQTDLWRKMSGGFMILLLASSLLLTIALTWRMTRPPDAYKPVPTPLPEQSQLIMEETSGTGPFDSLGRQNFVQRTSLSGRDGSINWQLKAGTSEAYAISGDVIYDRLFLTKTNEVKIIAYELVDGKELWATIFKSPHAANELPFLAQTDKILMAQGKLYLCIYTTIYVLSTQDGRILKTITGDLSGYPDAVLANYAMSNGVLLLNYSYSAGVGDSLHDLFVALQISDDKVLWKSTLGQYTDFIALQDGVFYTQSKSVVALRAQDGSQIWQASFPQLHRAGGTAFGQHVYVKAQNSAGSTNSTIYVLDTHDGHLLWKVPASSWNGGLPVEANDIAYITDANTLTAYQPDSGERLWQFKNEPYGSRDIAFDPYDLIGFTQPVFLNGVLFVGANFVISFPYPLRLIPNFCLGPCQPLTGVYAFNAENGQIYWYYHTNAYVKMLQASTA